MENAGLGKWKNEAGEGAALSAAVVRVTPGRVEKTGAAVNWNTNEITFETNAEAVVDIYLTAVEAEPEQAGEPVAEEPAGEEPAEEKQAEQEQAGEPAAEQPAEEPAAEEQPAEEPAAEEPAEEKPAEEPAAEIPEEAPAAEGAAAEAPATEEPAVEEPGPGEPAEAEAAEEPVPFNQSTVVDGVRITVTAAPGVFPAGAVLSVTRVTAAQQAQVDRAIDRVQDDRTQVAVSYSFDIRIQATTSQEQYASTARIFGLINALGYDYPHSDAEMTVRYMDLLAAYTDFMEVNKEKLAAEEIVYWTVSTDKGNLEFQFMAISGRLRMMYDLMYLED